PLVLDWRIAPRRLLFARTLGACARSSWTIRTPADLHRPLPDRTVDIGAGSPPVNMLPPGFGRRGSCRQAKRSQAFVRWQRCCPPTPKAPGRIAAEKLPLKGGLRIVTLGQ